MPIAKMSNFPGGFKNGVTIQGQSILNNQSGNVWWVSSVTGADGNSGTFMAPFATIDRAFSFAAAGDQVMVKAGHVETITSASAISMDVAGVAVIGLGQGSKRPTLTFSSAVSASVVISAAGITVQNIVGVAGINALTNPFSVTASDCYLDIEWQDGSASIEANRAILGNASADKLQVNLKYVGFTAGSSCVNAVRLVGSDGAIVNCDFYGKASTAWVEFLTTACTNVEVYGYMYNSGTTNFTKSVVDTATGSTWFASFFDGAAGASVSGGSGAALASDDISTVAANMNVPTADSTANVLERDVVGNKTDASVTAVTTTVSLMGYLKGAIAWLTVASADASTNAAAKDVLGNKTDASVYVPGTTNSLAAYAKGTANLQERVVTSATAALGNGTVLFTITGGPIKIESLHSECMTAQGAAATTLQYSVTPTVGAAQTISGASASLISVAAGATVTLAGTALATAALLNANGPNLIANPGTILCPAGTLTSVVTNATTGTWRHILRYKPLTVGVTVA